MQQPGKRMDENILLFRFGIGAMGYLYIVLLLFATTASLFLSYLDYAPLRRELLAISRVWLFIAFVSLIGIYSQAFRYPFLIVLQGNIVVIRKRFRHPLVLSYSDIKYISRTRKGKELYLSPLLIDTIQGEKILIAPNDDDLLTLG